MSTKGKAKNVPKENYDYPSGYGSHKSMIVEGKELSDSNFVVCKDEDGLYATLIKRIDSGLADPYRCSHPDIRKKLLAKLLK